MKKSLFAILLVLCIACGCATSVAAATPATSFDPASLTEVSTSVEYLEDGSYLVTTVATTPTPRAETYTKYATKEVTLYNSSDVLQWVYKLIGTFVIEHGVSSVCTNSVYSYNIYDDSWSIHDASDWYTPEAAYGKATFKRRVLFITTSTQNLEGAVRCDCYGVIS